MKDGLEKIVNEIEELHMKGKDLSISAMLNSNPRLYWVARYHFRSWKNAIKKSGLNYGDLKRTNTWSKRKILDQIQKLYQEGKNLRSSIIKESNNALYKAAYYYFGSWSKAIEATYRKIKESLHPKNNRWTKKDVVAKLKELHQQGQELSHKKLQVGPYSPVFYAAYRLFGSYEKAIQAMDLNYEDIRMCSKWTRKNIIAMIKELDRQSQELNLGAIKNSNPPLYGAACRYFGSWRKAVEAVGLDYELIKKT